MKTPGRSLKCSGKPTAGNHSSFFGKANAIPLPILYHGTTEHLIFEPANIADPLCQMKGHTGQRHVGYLPRFQASRMHPLVYITNAPPEPEASVILDSPSIIAMERKADDGNSLRRVIFDGQSEIIFFFVPMPPVSFSDLKLYNVENG